MADFKGKKGHWVTTESGSHVFIESGKSFDEAISDAFGKENAKKYKKADDYDYDKPYSSLYGYMDNPDDFTDVDGTKIKKSDLDKMDIQYGKSKADPDAYDRLEGIPDVEEDEDTEAKERAKFEEAKKIITNAGLKETGDTIFDHSLKMDYAKGRITKEEMLNQLKQEWQKIKDIENRDFFKKYGKENQTFDEEDYEAFDDDLNDLNWARANNISEDSLAKLKEKWEELRDIDSNAISWLELKDWTEKNGYDATLSQLESEINESFDNDYEEEFNDSEPGDELDKNDSKEDKMPNELKNWIERNKDVMDVDIETPSGDDTIYFKTKNKNTGEETQYSWNERTGITDHTNNKHFGSLDSEQNTSIEKNKSTKKTEPNWKEEGYESKEHYDNNQNALQTISDLNKQRDEETDKLEKDFNDGKITSKELVDRSYDIYVKYQKLIEENYKKIKG